MTELWQMSGLALGEAIARREVSALEVLDAIVKRVEAVNPQVNAVVTRAVERQDFVPEQDAVLVERLRAAGCPIFAKTNTPDHGGKFATDNMVFGATNNPWDLSRSPGGSSGGAAAQVAAGMGPLAVGNDGGGSIRVPASMCGVYGLKPQFGRVPSWPRHNGWYTLNHEGPITRTVRDAAALLDILAGPDERDWFSLPAQSGSYLEACNGEIKGMRVA